jgi:thioredoxin-dependent peroxiredoxin
MRKWRHVMRRLFLSVILAAALSATAGPEALALELGKPAPDFSLPAATGETISLRQFRGKRIVLLEFFGAAFAPT